MSTKYTPGPWRVVQQKYDTDNDTDIRGPINADKSSEYIATMSGCNDTPDNALLIAAAPEMLEALERTLEAHGACDGRGCFCAEVQSALRKARGE